jgi:hypothetical protein
MRIYADRTPTAIRQIVTDLLVAAWVFVSIRAAMWVHDLIEKLAWPTILPTSAAGSAGSRSWATT